jgi:hypothetical protein
MWSNHGVHIAVAIYPWQRFLQSRFAPLARNGYIAGSNGGA